jgi:hypothetical protein
MPFLTDRLLKRVAHGVPVARLLLAGEVAMMAGRHVRHLTAAERRRLAAILAAAARHPRSLSRSDQVELAALVAKLEPRLFVGSAVRRVSPVPIPARLLYGRRGSTTRRAARALKGRRRS